MSGLVKVFDASEPPTSMPVPFRGAGGYIGGRTPHVWTVQEWNRFAVPGNEVRLFPYWVADFGASPKASAVDAHSRAYSLGWRPGRCIILDTEAEVDRSWVSEWTRYLSPTGFYTVNYGSMSVVAQNGCPMLLVAHWDNDPVLEGGQRVIGHQYAADVQTPQGLVDANVFAEELWSMGGYGLRE